MTDQMQINKSRFIAAMQRRAESDPDITPEIIDKNAEAIALMPLYCSGAIYCVSLIVYTRLENDLNDGLTYYGNAGGVSSPGGTTAYGDLYTNSYDTLIANTASFMYDGVGNYFSMTYFDSSSTVLGTMQTGGLGTVVGTGGGTGAWREPGLTDATTEAAAQ